MIERNNPNNIGIQKMMSGIPASWVFCGYVTVSHAGAKVAQQRTRRNTSEANDPNRRSQLTAPAERK